jgi:hypothetical protein
MSDTVKIERPLHCRRNEDFGGRIKIDSLGNPITVRTRSHDHQYDLSLSWPAIAANLDTGATGR